jgi:hypothetical protein
MPNILINNLDFSPEKNKAEGLVDDSNNSSATKQDRLLVVHKAHTTKSQESKSAGNNSLLVEASRNSDTDSFVSQSSIGKKDIYLSIVQKSIQIAKEH